MDIFQGTSGLRAKGKKYIILKYWIQGWFFNELKFLMLIVKTY
jgi:hypothetical protein